MKIVFFGTSSFAAHLLSKLIEHDYQVVAVVTRPDKPSGRALQLSFSPVKKVSVEIAPLIPLFQPNKASSPEFAEVLRSFDADLFVVVAYGEIIKQNLLNLPKKGCINVHPSLLPRFRGASPIRRCLMSGEEKTGVAIIEMTPEMDAGDVLAMEEVAIPFEMTFGELEPLLCSLSATLLLKVVKQFEAGTVSKRPQDHTQVTFAPKISPSDERIDWRNSATVIHHQIRALSPRPGAWSGIKIGEGNCKRLKIIKAVPIPGTNFMPGSVVVCGREGWVVACGEGCLRLLEVQLEGKKTLRSEDFIRGIRQPILIENI